MLTMIAIGGAIGTGLFLDAGGRLNVEQHVKAYWAPAQKSIA